MKQQNPRKADSVGAHVSAPATDPQAPDAPGAAPEEHPLGRPVVPPALEMDFLTM
jgi:hypothetical protein